MRRDFPKKGAATHDIAAPIKEITKAAAKLLKYGGKFFMCFPARRLCDAFTALSSAGLEPKRLRLVAGKPEAAPYLALIEAKKAGQKKRIDY